MQLKDAFFKNDKLTKLGWVACYLGAFVALTLQMGLFWVIGVALYLAGVAIAGFVVWIVWKVWKLLQVKEVLCKPGFGFWVIEVFEVLLLLGIVALVLSILWKIIFG